jgi:integration host factor subunit alpha
MTLVKEDLIQSLYRSGRASPSSNRRPWSKRCSSMIKKSLESGDDVLISGFGKFSVKTKAPRRGRNPSTGEDLTLDARRVVMFKCSGF